MKRAGSSLYTNRRIKGRASDQRSRFDLSVCYCCRDRRARVLLLWQAEATPYTRLSESSTMVSNGKGKSCALLLLLTLLSAVLVADVRARSALQRRDQPGGGLIDTRFWQGILNKTLDGNVEQAFNMVIGRMSDDISGAMNRFTGFLDTVRRNVTSVIQDGMRTRNTAT